VKREAKMQRPALIRNASRAPKHGFREKDQQNRRWLCRGEKNFRPKRPVVGISNEI
jgi:hypothetical protein